MENQNNIISPEILQHLSSDDKSVLLESLATLIQSTYGTEQEFKKLQNDFNALKALYEWVLELIPQAVWVLEADKSVFYQNEHANKLKSMLPSIINLQEGEHEVEFEGQFYLLQNNRKNDKQVMSATHITNQKRQERLASMGQVSAHLAHEIRNPIGSISLLTSSLLKRGDEQIKPLVFEMKKALWRVERLINATLLFTKGVNPNRQIHALIDFESDLYDSVGYYTYSKPIEFSFKLCGGDVNEILADFDLLSIVLQNFLSNAIDAIEEGECEAGQVSVAFSDESDFWCFSISDNGVGIQDKNILFEPFKTTKLKGNGLGLALCQQIVAAHNGSIELQDSQTKKTFFVKIAKN
ncbi:two component system sensor histidine kinase [Helicobacter cinaedi]|uniref:histidine kinase n=1 Tax=Helicobacter cinaedi TaxID=213 RepID=A0A377JS25_9HELI|nr:HAMP domain-containing sensor histidine kinase [Helicobacter cinaedi]STP10736.1 two component system sensor histidine kinase [Helicobacter cinaedi]